MGSKSAGPGGQMGGLGGVSQGQGDVQPFDMPPMQQAPYNPYNMTTSADMNRQAPPMQQAPWGQSGMRPPSMPPAPYNPYNMTTSADMNRQAPPMSQDSAMDFMRFLQNYTNSPTDALGAPGMNRPDQPMPQAAYNPYNMTTSADMNRQPPPAAPKLPAPRLGGQGPMPQMTNDDYLNQLYRAELGREPDQGGMDFWRQQMSNGIGRDQIQKLFDQSEEGQGYNQRIRPMIDDFGSNTPSGSGPRTQPGPNVPPMPQAPYNPYNMTTSADMNRQAPPMPQPLTSPISQALRLAQQPRKNPDSPEVQDALRIARGLPVY